MTWLTGGHNNWFSVNVSGREFELKINQGAKYLENDFDTVANKAAVLLKNEWNDKPLYLALSGGLDSELVARILFQNEIPFTPVILKISNLNQHETWYAEYWCHQHKITPVILNYSLVEYNNALAKFFPKLHEIKNYAQTPILILYDYIHKANGYGIYAAGDINLDNKKFYCNSLDFISNIIDVGNHPTSFFMYTPELALSYVNRFNIAVSEQYNKLNFYKVAPRPKLDYIHALHSLPEIRDTLDKLNHIFKTNQTPFNGNHWYGTKEQLMNDLQTK